MKQHAFIVALASAGLTACVTPGEQAGTLAELETLPSDVEEVYLDDSLDRAAQSYRRYLEEAPTSALTPEAMRRLADLQLEREYGVIGGGNIVEMASRGCPLLEVLVRFRQFSAGFGGYGRVFFG